jgi:hypothetical protein
MTPPRFHPLLSVVLICVCALASAGCGGNDPMVHSDAGVALSDEHSDCSDGVFCNGQERCMPSSALANARGCLPAASPPCDATGTCVELDRRCVPLDCQDGDRDGDGHIAVGCGGTDCDDDDGARFPGNPEVCDALGHDEDCDPCTVSAGSSLDGDLDVDSYVSSACWNFFNAALATPACDVARLRFDTAAMAVVGRDCDDASSAVHPGVVGELCDGVDNDCDGDVDEGVLVDFVCDGDGDGHLPPTGTVRVPACQPPTTPCAGQWIPSPAPTYYDDCDDTDLAIFGSNVEFCDGKDNDCDPTTFGPREDDDRDGFTSFQCGGDDCDDNNPFAFPGATEVCNHVVESCGQPVDYQVTRYCAEDLPSTSWWGVTGAAGGVFTSGAAGASSQPQTVWSRATFDVGSSLSVAADALLTVTATGSWSLFVTEPPTERASGNPSAVVDILEPTATTGAVVFTADYATGTFRLESIGPDPATLTIAMSDECRGATAAAAYDVLFEFESDGSVDVALSTGEEDTDCNVEIEILVAWQALLRAPIINSDGSRSPRPVVMGHAVRDGELTVDSHLVRSRACACFAP